MWYIVFLRGFSPVSYGVYFFCFATAYDKGCARMFPPSKVVSGFRVCLGSLDRGLGYFRVQGVPAGGGGGFEVLPSTGFREFCCSQLALIICFFGGGERLGRGVREGVPRFCFPGR